MRGPGLAAYLGGQPEVPWKMLASLCRAVPPPDGVGGLWGLPAEGHKEAPRSRGGNAT